MKAVWMVTCSAVVGPLLIVALSIPMALRRVPPNGFYGFRTAKTMSDQRVWYDANEKAGINLLVAGCLSLVVWAVLRFSMGAQMAAVAGISAQLALLLASVVVSFVQLSKM